MICSVALVFAVQQSEMVIYTRKCALCCSAAAAKSLQCVRLCVTPETAAHQAPPSLGFSRQEHWSGLPFPSPGDLPDPGIEPESLMSRALAGRFLHRATLFQIPSYRSLREY